MLCNLVEDMLSNWMEAWIAVHSMKTKIAEIDAQLTAMDKSFSWKGTISISSMNVHNSGGGAQGGGASGSETGGCTITSLGGNGSATGCSTKTPCAKPFPVPSTVEPLFKRLKDSLTPQMGHLPPSMILAPTAATNSPAVSQEERWACPIIEELPSA